MDLDFQAILDTFLADAEEHLTEMEDRLLRLEAGEGGPEDLAELFRLAHSLKGDAACVSLQPVADLAHVLEDLLEALRDEQVAASPELHATLLDGVDELRRMLPDAAAGRTLGEGPTEVARRLRTLAHPSAGGDAEATAGAWRDVPTGETSAEADAEPDTEAPRAAAAGTVRVDLDKLDRLLNLTGELAIGRGRVRDLLETSGDAGVDAALEAHADLEHAYLELQELVLDIRMVPVGPVLRQHVRTVRDLAKAHGRLARLVIRGGEVDADTAILQKLRDPLMHLVRNAVVHGIETPAERSAAGKDPVGTVILSASHEAGQVVLRVSDDGRGLDTEAIRRKAADLGLPPDREPGDLVFHPALSTAARLTGDAGRGVGLDVVRRNVEALRGQVTVEPRQGGGTTFVLRVPLTLLIIDGFSLEVAGENYVVPLEHVVECVDLPTEGDPSALYDCMELRDEVLPLVRLRRLFDAEGEAPGRESVVVVADQARRAGLVVDALLGQHQTVLKKSVGGLIEGSEGIGASTVLGDGRVALVLDVPSLLTRAEHSATAEAS